MFLAIVLLPLSRRLALKMNIVDVPDPRRVHLTPTPKSGGIAVVLGALVPVLIWAPLDAFGQALLIGLAIVVMFGLIDDWKGINYKTKFIGQLAAALIVILYGGIKIKSLGMLLPDDVLLPDWLAIPLTIVVIVGVTNAVNFSDGLDGLAGGICLFSFICLGYLGYRADNTVVALFAIAVTGALFGFLRFNTFPAVLFMGDGGAQFLGFSAIALSINLTQINTPLSPLLPLFLLGIPVLDTLRVIFVRLQAGKSPFMPDKNHLHHKLLSLNFTHAEAVLIIYVMQALLVTSAFVFRYHSDWFLLILYGGFSFLLIAVLFLADRTDWQFKHFDIVELILLGNLKTLINNNTLIKVSFRSIELGLPLLVLFTCVLPASIPNYFSYFSLGLFGLIIISWTVKSSRSEDVLRLVSYLFIPFVVYQGETNLPLWMDGFLPPLYNLSFWLLAVFIIFTLKFSKRGGFKSTPMDFLILFIALIVPNLPDDQIQSYQVGLMAAKIIILCFSYEVLIGELRGKLTWIRLTTLAALVIICIKGFLS